MGKLVRRLLAAGGVLLLAFGLFWVGGSAYGNCSEMPDDPMCQPPQTSPPVHTTSPPQTSPQSQTNTHVTSNSSTNNNTPSPQPGGRTVTRTPPKETFTPRRPATNYQPAVPDAPAATQDFEQPDADVPLPAVQLGAVPIAQPTPMAAPAPPPPPAPKAKGPGAVPLGAAAAVGIGAGVALAAKPKDDPIASNLKVAGTQLAVGGVLVVGTEAAVNAGAVSIAASAIAAPVGIAVGVTLLLLGMVNLLTAFPKTPSSVQLGSTRG